MSELSLWALVIACALAACAIGTQGMVLVFRHRNRGVVERIEAAVVFGLSLALICSAVYGLVTFATYQAGGP